MKHVARHALLGSVAIIERKGEEDDPAAIVTKACGVASGSGKEPTLRQETLIETFRSVASDCILLSRRHNVEITSLVADDDTLAPTDLDVDPEAGLVRRLSNGSPINWRASLITVTYKAGFEKVPPSLVGVVQDLVRQRLGDASPDAIFKSKSVEIPDVEITRVERWPAATSGPLPPDILNRLSRFNLLVGL